ncbi:MAG: hypothetical protein VB859_04835 [Planctomycetaceae bacterium]
MSVETVSLVADLHTVRCGGCKVAVEDPMAVSCSVCGSTFGNVTSIHVGLAARLNVQRDGIVSAAADGEEMVAVPRSVLAELAAALAEVDGADKLAAVAGVLAESSPTVSAGKVADAAVKAGANAREAGSLA